VGFVRKCSCSDTGNMKLPYNRPGIYLVHVLFSQLTAQGGLPENPGMRQLDTHNLAKDLFD